MQNFLVLKEFLFQHRYRYLLGVLWLILVDLLQLIIPKILGWFADDFQKGILTLAGAGRYAAWLAAAALGVAFLRFLWRLYIMGTARKLEYYLRNRLFSHLELLSPSFYDHSKTGDLMAHATNDINAVRMAFGLGIVMITDIIILTSITLFIMLRTIDVKLTLIAMAPLPILAAAATGFGQVIHQRFRKVQEAFSNLTDEVQESLAGIRVVKSFVQEGAAEQRFRAANRLSVEMNLRLARVSALFEPSIELLSALSFLLALAYGGHQVVAGVISLGDFVAFNSYLAMLAWPMLAVGWTVNVLQRGAASMGRVKALLGTDPEIADSEATDYSITSLPATIRVANLTFGYGGPAVLDRINFSLPQGGTLGIVGRTGCGKSTLVNLLLRLYDPPAGTVYFGAADVRHIPLGVLRRDIGYVPQDSFLFSTSIAVNIAFAPGQYSREEVEAAARVTAIDQDVAGFANGWDTTVGERGVTLSGGQKQRLALARALLKNPAVLILDDSLSAVDAATEALIIKNLRQRRQGLTNIIISHRLSCVSHADTILVLDQGRIAERGTHQELMDRRGLYYGIYAKQQLAAALTKDLGDLQT